MRDLSPKLVPLLEDGVPVMIYAGDKDLICNHVGNRRWVDGLEWSGAAAWRQAADEDWSVPGESAAAGSVASSGPLSFVRVFDGGHMVPMDQPAAALHMIASFVYGRPLGPLPTLTTPPPPTTTTTTSVEEVVDEKAEETEVAGPQRVAPA